MKNKILLVLLILLLFALGFLSYIFFSNLNSKQKDDYMSEITTMGETLYSDYYYKVVSVNKTEEELKTFLKKYEIIGFKFDLNAIETYNDDYRQKVEEFIEKYDECKKEDIVVTIYPKHPYGSSNFTSQITDNCKVK